VNKVGEQDPLNGQTRMADNIERVVMVRRGFFVREDQYGHAIMHEDVISNHRIIEDHVAFQVHAGKSLFEVPGASSMTPDELIVTG
jgi:hypothetical protein